MDMPLVPQLFKEKMNTNNLTWISLAVFISVFTMNFFYPTDLWFVVLCVAGLLICWKAFLILKDGDEK